MPHELTHLDLFSGIGGFALAAQRAGFKNSSVEYWQKQRVAHKKLWRAETKLALAAIGITRPKEKP